MTTRVAMTEGCEDCRELFDALDVSDPHDWPDRDVTCVGCDVTYAWAAVAEMWVPVAEPS